MRWAALSAVLVAVGARLVYGPGVLGYDAVWALVWGEEIASAAAPSLDAAVAPTPHPLANLVTAALSPLGPGDAGAALLALSWLSLGALAVALAWLGAELFSWPVGVLAAAVVVTRPLVVAEAGQAIVDVPFVALAVGAALVEVRRPRRGVAVPVLLALAGGLRPEGWALGVAYLAYRREPRLLGLALAAPALWAAMDLWGTGDPLHSLHGTQALGEALGRPTGATAALDAAPEALRQIVRTPLLWVALAGAAAGLLARERASALPAGVTGLGLLGFGVLGVAGLPVLDRYLLLPATMLALFAGLAVLGWTTPPRTPHAEAERQFRAVRGARNRRSAPRSAVPRGWLALGVVAAGVAVAGAPGDVDELRRVDAFTAERRAVQADLRRTVRALDRRCRRVLAPDSRSRAVVRLHHVPGDRGQAVITATDPAVRRRYALGETRRARPPRGAARRYAGPYFRADARGC